ncbi:hypothetical protein VTN49DRAFT_5408 [Thermomyces lanuginosus]|uniref:uncharacterized protein n=1 Tax=Thermomyces lanuginosus TaxID=5541 RepID=UPI0037430A1C
MAFTLLALICAFSNVAYASFSYTIGTLGSSYRNGSSSGTFRSVAYFVDWSIYERNFVPQDLKIDSLTHVLYAFGSINATTAEIQLADSYADIEKRFPGDSQDESGRNLYGCLKQLFLLKKKKRNLKTLFSIGGYTYSPSFSIVSATQAGRKRFASSAVRMIQDLGFDGIDIDWEFPANSTEAKNMVLLLREVRSALDNYSSKYGNNTRLLLSVASPAGPSAYKKLHFRAMDRYVDFWNLMAYEYSGSWSPRAAHSANVYASASHPCSTPFNTDQAINYYISHGVDPKKINLGIPLYGKSFANTSGPGAPFEGVGAGEWDGSSGIWDYKSLPQPGATVYELDQPVASYSYDKEKKVMISYDTPNIVRWKGQYILRKGLGGGMYWETSGDKSGNESLIGTLVNELGGSRVLDQSQNLLNYPASKFDNLRAGFETPAGDSENRTCQLSL